MTNVSEQLPTDEETEMLQGKIDKALVHARATERAHGLISHQSAEAWKIVDELYYMSAAARDVEDSMQQQLSGRERDNIWNQLIVN